MTKDEVMGLTDDQLRKIILRSSGWHCNLDGNMWAPKGKEDSAWYGYYEKMPNYPNDIAAAWQLINASIFVKEFNVVVLNIANYLGDDETEWMCVFAGKTGAFCMKAALAARAITRTYILAKKLTK